MSERVFKTAWFAKAAKKARISDKALSKAIGQLPLDRPTISAVASSRSASTTTCIVQLFWRRPGSSGCSPISSPRRIGTNIDDDELLAFRKLADLYRGKAKADLEAELEIGALLEIDHGD